MRIGELADKTHVSVDTLRYYEKIGLMPAVKRRGSGQRVYGDAELETLCFIKRAQLMAFSLKEIAELLKIRSNEHVMHEQAQLMARDKLVLLDEQITELTELRQELSAMLADCEQSSSDGDCPIIQGLQHTK
ncbi:MerR family copper efflux transcriptional regulator/MerR family gold-responsive transcriptional activator of gol and ges genes [Sinobacterium caligoides]|uniref:MerR family copper efflux transcriptional regulator/MerR family gold-responsive transcriptional activator of gol and ges genes n=1 Tax=Sinobacterium caligoides TaxID=933926 RepID=A0A3N2DGM5_9GAMM|nr:heavy metal-responsive transcriptional regulator [Sinobacterium caligoides]ROR98937.1 MerR family copper efflux transcriptional regulator/MerR family gold-responsive transcriptional activator of gol and ges genes [Sinobacterium caligoides]